MLYKAVIYSLLPVFSSLVYLCIGVTDYASAAAAVYSGVVMDGKIKVSSPLIRFVGPRFKRYISFPGRVVYP